MHSKDNKDRKEAVKMFYRLDTTTRKMFTYFKRIYSSNRYRQKFNNSLYNSECYSFMLERRHT